MTFPWTIPACFLIAAVSGFGAGKTPENYLVFLGTYTRGGKGEGIYSSHFDARTGKLGEIRLAAKTPDPTLLAVHPNGRVLYSVNAEKNGGVSAFSIDAAIGKLTLLNRVSSKGDGPTFIAVDKTAKWVLVANYNSGSIASLPIENDGSLGEAVSFIQHKGSSVNRERQQGPHAHFITLSPDNRFAIVCDLGLDEVLVYRFDAATGMLSPNDPPFTKVDPGAGPRHFAFRPDGRFAYAIDEMASRINAFAWDPQRGSLRDIQNIGTLPEGYSGDNTGSEIAVHPNGRYLYGSNRGQNTIAVFAIDQRKGTLTPLGNVSTQGKTPRFFTLDPTGRYLFAANQDSDSVVVLHLDPKTGRLSPAGAPVALGAPVSVAFVGLP